MTPLEKIRQAEAPKTYELKTIADILAVVNPANKDCFLKDFTLWLEISLAVKDMETVVQKDDAFRWIDDGKNDVSIKISVQEPPSHDL